MKPRDQSSDSSSLYARIGEDTVKGAITEFYRRAFEDPILSHFFFGKDRQHITSQQIDFATSMLGGKLAYRGKPLIAAHRPFAIRGPHFDRRQVLMREVLAELNLAPDLAAAWLQLEEHLRALIVNT